MTFDKQSNGRRTAIELKTNRICNYRMSNKKDTNSTIEQFIKCIKSNYTMNS